VDCFLEFYEQPPPEIWIDLDATDDPTHGRQEGRFFHGYYGHYCYLRLYIFSDEHLLCARLRPSNIDAAAGSVEELDRIVGQIRARWSKTKWKIGSRQKELQCPAGNHAPVCLEAGVDLEVVEIAVESLERFPVVQDEPPFSVALSD
jgi:hypothetical protein